jgi:hypothetical protein
VQSLMAFYIWGNEPTIMGVLGIFTTLGGSLLYTFVKMGENAAAPAQVAPQPVSQGENREQEMTSRV